MRMKIQHLILFSLSFVTLTSCYITPRARSPYSPGGRAVLPGERHPHSPLSPGGVLVLPHEARPMYHRGIAYHTHRGVWYRPVGRGYVVCPRPY